VVEVQPQLGAEHAREVHGVLQALLPRRRVGVAAVEQHRAHLATGLVQVAARELHRGGAHVVLGEDGRGRHRLARGGGDERHVQVAGLLHAPVDAGGDEALGCSHAHG
jgi:hypothetical protein